MFTDIQRISYLRIPNHALVKSEAFKHFIKEGNELFFICPSCSNKENCISILRRSLFPLTALIYGHVDMLQIFETDIIHSWDHEHSFGILWSSTEDEVFCTIQEILEYMNDANQIPMPPSLDYGLLDIKFTLQDKGDVVDCPLFIKTLDGDYLGSLIPIAQYAEKGISGLTYHCPRCHDVVWARDGDFIQLGQHYENS